jgi:hypothetical protein
VMFLVFVAILSLVQTRLAGRARNA